MYLSGDTVIMKKRPRRVAPVLRSSLLSISNQAVAKTGLTDP